MKQPKRSGYDITDWFRDNPNHDLKYLISHLDEFKDPEHPDDMSTVQRVYTLDEISKPSPVSSEKLAQINGRRSSGELCVSMPPRPKVSDMFELSDLGNAERFVKRYGDKFRYVPQWGWLSWDGMRWKRDEGDLITLSAAAETARSIREEADGLWGTESNLAKKIIKHCLKSEGSGRIAAIANLARFKLSAESDSFDKHHLLLNFKNGTYDISNGDFREHARSDMITQVSPILYNPDAESPTWNYFYDSILPTIDRKQFVQDAIGYSATGSVREQCMFVCWGTGQNGKSTFMDAISHIMGDYAVATPPAMLVSSKTDQHPTILTTIRGKRFSCAQETEDGERLSESQVKQLTGGDQISARTMNKDFFTFWPTHKIWLSTNHKPIIKGTDKAIWRRMRLIPFTITVPEDKRDPDLPEKLRAESSGILNWILSGARRWHSVGLQVTEEIQQSTNTYRAEQDTVGQWIDDNVIGFANNQIRKDVVYRNYRTWCTAQGIYPLSQRRLTDQMRDRGYHETRDSIARYWLGIDVRDSNNKFAAYDGPADEGLPF